ncbi:hypothetical protein GGF37_006486, partial [Kickxella alabastrina]
MADHTHNEPKDWKKETAKYTLGGAAFGVFVSAFQTAYGPGKGGSALDVLTKNGSTIGFM